MQYVSRVRKEDAHDDGIWSVAWSANGQIVTGSCDEVVQTYMVHGQQIEKKHELRGHHLGVTSVSVSAEGNLAASSALDSHIRLWDLEKGEEVRTIDAGPVEAWTVAVSPDGATVASGSQGGNVNLWSVGSGEKAATLQGSSGKFTMSVAYSADGKYVASGHADGAVCVFDAEKGKLVHKLAGHALTVRTLAFSRDGALLVSGSDDCHANVYDVVSGSQVASLEGHSSWVLGVAFAADDSHIATCSSDHSVRTWSTAERQCLQTFADAHSDRCAYNFAVHLIRADHEHGATDGSAADARAVRPPHDARANAPT